LIVKQYSTKSWGVRIDACWQNATHGYFVWTLIEIRVCKSAYCKYILFWTCTPLQSVTFGVNRTGLLPRPPVRPLLATLRWLVVIPEHVCPPALWRHCTRPAAASQTTCCRFNNHRVVLSIWLWKLQCVFVTSDTSIQYLAGVKYARCFLKVQWYRWRLQSSQTWWHCPTVSEVLFTCHAHVVRYYLWVTLWQSTTVSL